MTYTCPECGRTYEAVLPLKTATCSRSEKGIYHDPRLMKEEE